MRNGESVSGNAVWPVRVQDMMDVVRRSFLDLQTSWSKWGVRWIHSIIVSSDYSTTLSETVRSQGGHRMARNHSLVGFIFSDHLFHTATHNPCFGSLLLQNGKYWYQVRWKLLNTISYIHNSHCFLTSTVWCLLHALRYFSFANFTTPTRARS